MTARGYGGENIRLEGEVMGIARYGDQEHQLNLLIVTEGKNLLSKQDAEKLRVAVEDQVSNYELNNMIYVSSN